MSFVKFCKSPFDNTVIKVGLLAATITGFIIYIQPNLQQDPKAEVAGLLSLLIYTTNGTLFTQAPALPDWNGGPVFLTVAQIILYCSLAATLLCGWYGLVVKFFTDSCALGWKNRFLDWLTRWIFVVMYLLLAGVFFGIFLALTLQVPFLPSIGSISFGALGKVKVG